LGPETKGRNRRTSANGDRDRSERRRKTQQIAGLSQQSQQNAKTADWMMGIEPVTLFRYIRGADGIPRRG
jgi:hypothetical protein